MHSTTLPYVEVERLELSILAAYALEAYVYAFHHTSRCFVLVTLERLELSILSALASKANVYAFHHRAIFNCLAPLERFELPFTTPATAKRVETFPGYKGINQDHVLADIRTQRKVHL